MRRDFLKQSGIMAGMAFVAPLFINGCTKRSTEYLAGDDDLNPPDNTGAENIVSYPQPPTTETSTDFALWANGVPIWVEKYEAPTPQPPYSGNRESSFVARAGDLIGDVQRVAIARFSSAGSTRITIDLEETAQTCVVRPKSKSIQAAGLGTKRISFEVTGKQYFYIEINDLPPLMVFVDLPETDVPNPNDPLVRYFGPGFHEVGLIELGPDETVYLAPGALVSGRIYLAAVRCKIKGRGILDATVYSTGENGTNVIHTHFVNNFLVRDVMIRNKKHGWLCNISNSTNVTFENAIILGFGANNDGIDLIHSRSVNINGCFFRCTDDCITLKSNPNATMQTVRISDCTLYGFASSDAIAIGPELKGPMKDVRIANCDIIGGRGNSSWGGKAAFSVICDGPGPVTAIEFDNIRVEDRVTHFNLDITVTDGQRYSNMVPGSIDGVKLKNVHWERADRPLVIHGYSANNKVKNITFENCSVAGVPLTSLGDADISVNSFAENIQFT